MRYASKVAGFVGAVVVFYMLCPAGLTAADWERSFDLGSPGGDNWAVAVAEFAGYVWTLGTCENDAGRKVAVLLNHDGDGGSQRYWVDEDAGADVLAVDFVLG
ncbi:hypothetical protein JXB37_01345 [candidate division WOR-3 bacterium]|nr:hypothetical protein [candidate division WOR-3 bacterium]